LGCCLYSLAFLQNCFEEGSNLAILSRNYKIPDHNPYGDDLAELIDRMLTVNCKERSDMTEVILCLSAIYSGRPLPPRKISAKSGIGEDSKRRVGAYRTDGQGIRGEKKSEEKKPAEAKKLNPNSAAARRRKAAQSGGTEGNPTPFTRTTSKIRKPLTPSPASFDQSFGIEGFTFQNDDTGFDPFHVGESDGAFKDDYESSELSQDGGFDFVSDNGSGFDTFGSDDSRADKTLQHAVAKANQNLCGARMDSLNFEGFKIRDNGGSSSNILRKKKKGLKKLFRKNETDGEI
jgi:hypothetical protein